MSDLEREFVNAACALGVDHPYAQKLLRDIRREREKSHRRALVRTGRVAA